MKIIKVCGSTRKNPLLPICDKILESDYYFYMITLPTRKKLCCRSPFRGDKDYTDKKTQLLELSFEMATSAHRDRFSEHPNRTIRNICELLAKMADSIIQVNYCYMTFHFTFIKLAFVGCM